MTDNYHTPIAAGADGIVATVNSPLGELDAAITSEAPGIIWSQSSQSAADNTNAPALPEHKSTDDLDFLEAIRFAYQKQPGVDNLAIRGQYYQDPTVNATIRIKNVTTTDVSTGFIAGEEGDWTDFDETDDVLDISGLSDGETYEFILQLEVAITTGDPVTVRHLAVVVYP